MTTSMEVALDPLYTSEIEHAPAGKRSFSAFWVLLLCQAGALAIQVLAVCMARMTGSEQPWIIVSDIGCGLTYGSALWALTRPQLTLALRNTAVACLGVMTAVQWHVTDPLLFRAFDEQLHMRTLSDIRSSHGLFQPNPNLGVSPRYPGLESLTALVHQLGLPVMVSATLVVLVARLVLVLVLCDAVEQLTGSRRTGGLAVAVYAVSAQFVVFSSLFAYQTLALPLALAAVAFIARARWAADPRPLMAGATICLLAVVMTHHITSWLTAAFLVVWATAERGQARRRVVYGAAVALGAATVWAMIQWSLLRDYFGPIADDVAHQVTGGSRRSAFSDPAGYRTPQWEQLFLVYYALAVSSVIGLVMLTYVRSVWGRRRRGGRSSNSRRWDPQALLVLLTIMVPVTVALRAIPSAAELGDRSTGFLFLPVSLLVADYGVRWFRSLPKQDADSRPRRLGTAAYFLAILMATGVFLGGVLLGGGSDWTRLPGRYLVSADNRSMDPETLAAVRWAGEELPAASRIAADRVSSLLLASQAGLWPVMKDDRKELFAPRLYFADTWGSKESDLARGLNLHYLYVDRRFSQELPHEGAYFYKGETKGSEQLTMAELTKFDQVRGVHTVYRHGPISIYDLGGLYNYDLRDDPSGINVLEFRSGWWGKAPAHGIGMQLAIGLLLGLALALGARFGAGHIVAEKLKSFQKSAGPILTFAAGVATLLVVSATLLLAHIWLGPIVLISMGLAVLLANRFWANFLFRPKFLFRAKFLFGSAFLSLNSAVMHRWRGWIAALGMLVAVAIAQSVFSSYSEDVTKVRSILDDPSAVHAPVRNPPKPCGNC